MTANMRKRKADPTMKLAVDEKVEVRSVDEGMLGSWHSGTVIGCGEKTRTVRYDELMNENGSAVIEAVVVRPVLDGICTEDDDSESSGAAGFRGIIRPLPPPPSENSVHYGQCVDVYYNDAWWEGVILDREDSSDERRIFFPDLGDELGVKLDMLRLTQDWNESTGEWKVRGSWALLELLEKVEQSSRPTGVSVRQIWYEMQVPFTLRKLEWTCSSEDVLKELLLQVLSSNYSLFVRNVLHESSFAGDFVDENTRLIKSLSSGFEFSLKPEELFLEDKVTAIEAGSSSRRKGPYSDRLQWLTVILKGEQFPDSIAQYTSSKRSQEIAVSARKHLVYLGWEVQSARDKKITRMRYISPEGVMYDSLYKACLALQSKERAPPPLVENGDSLRCCIRIEGKTRESVMPKAKRTKRVSDLVKKGDIIKKASVSSKRVVYDKDSIQVRKGHLPKALVEYSKLRNSMSHTRIRKDEETEKLTSEVKRYLSGSGWTISRQLKGGKNELLYVAPTGRKFYSLLTVCEWCIEERNRSEQVTGDRGLVLSTSLPTQLDQIGEIKMLEKRRKEKGRKPVLKRVRQELTSSTHPRTILSWLIDGNIVSPREKIRYINRKDGLILKHGMITTKGIKCSCCPTTFSLSGFEVHAGSKLHRPSANIFLKDGRSLLQCQMQLKREERKEHHRQDSEGQPVNDELCAVCQDGGDIILCDQCPSAYHAECLGLQGTPAGDWFCPSCCCTICGLRISKEEEELSSINCGQCEHRHHIECLRNKGLVKPDFQPDWNWFCNKRCEQIYTGLQNLLGKSIPVGDDDVHWTLLKNEEDDLESEYVMENYGKLKDALSIMHECFVPYKDRFTGRDVAEDVIFSRWSELGRLNFEGFYTVALEKNDEIMTVANLRVHGGKVAEVPLIGTRFQNRRQGMCRILMNELEKKLMELGVERLVLPAIPTMLKTWESSFGFSVMKDSEKRNYLDCSILNFAETILCQKLLQKVPSSDSILPSEIQHKMVNLAINNTVSEAIQEFRVRDIEIIDQETADVSREGVKIVVSGSDIQGKMHDLDINNTVSGAIQEYMEDIEMADQEAADVSQGVEIYADGVHVPESQDAIQEQENQLPVGRDKIINVYKRRRFRTGQKN